MNKREHEELMMEAAERQREYYLENEWEAHNIKTTVDATRQNINELGRILEAGFYFDFEHPEYAPYKLNNLGLDENTLKEGLDGIHKVKNLLKRIKNAL